MADEYISKAELYKQIAEKEELARNRYLDTPSTLPVPIFVNPSYERYTAQLNERTAFKHMVADFPPADVVQVEILKAEIYKLKCQQDSKNQDYYTGYMSALSTVEGIIAEMGEE